MLQFFSMGKYTSYVYPAFLLVFSFLFLNAYRTLSQYKKIKTENE